MEQQVKFDKSFTGEIYKYLEITKKSGATPSVETFAQRLNVTAETLYSWANKKKKDEQGNVIEELARPKFNTALKVLEEQSKKVIEKKEEKLTQNQELFCKLYASEEEFFGNGTASYLRAYGLKREKPSDYKNAMSSASDLLRNPKILARINELLEDSGLNDAFVDKQLLFLIKQNVDFPTKAAAIREYNKLKTRITERVDHTTKGKALPTPILGGTSNVSSDDSN